MDEKTFSKKFLSAITLVLFCLTIVFGSMPTSKAEAVKAEDVITAIIVQQMVNKSLKYYENAGRSELLSEYKESEGVNTDPYLNSILDRIMQKLTKGIAKTDESIKDPPYNYFINNDTNFNAFCALGRNISVNTGVFAFFDNQEDKIAAVVAHEMAHGQKQHPLKEARKRLNVDLLSSILGADMGGVGQVAVGVVAEHAKNSGITKSNEKQADNLSFTYMADAGYNVGAPAAVWQRMIDQSGKKSKDFFAAVLNPSTHPGNEWRRDNFAKKLYEYSDKKVSVDAKTGEVKVNGKVFLKPTAFANMSGAERRYLIAGNLANIYHLGKQRQEAYAENGIVKIGIYSIVQSGPDDENANELARTLNSIK